MESPSSKLYISSVLRTLSATKFVVCRQRGHDQLGILQVESLECRCLIFLLWQPQHVLWPVPDYMHSQYSPRQTHIFHCKRLTQSPLKTCNFLQVLSDNKHIINIQHEDQEISSIMLLHKDTVVSLCLVESMVHREGFKLLVPLLGACFSPYKLFLSGHTRFSFPFSSNPSGCCM